MIEIIFDKKYFQINTSDKFQNYLINTFKNYNPDLIFFGHTQNIKRETIIELKNLNSKIILSQWNEDPIMKSLSYSKKNIENISYYSDIVDHNFITTDPNILKKQIKNINNLHFFLYLLIKISNVLMFQKSSPSKIYFTL